MRTYATYGTGRAGKTLQIDTSYVIRPSVPKHQHSLHHKAMPHSLKTLDNSVTIFLNKLCLKLEKYSLCVTVRRCPCCTFTI